MNAAGFRSLGLHRAYLGAGVALVGLYYALPWDTLGQKLVYDAIAASSAGAVALGAHINRPSLRWPWWLFAVGLLSFAVGDVIFNLYEDVWEREPPVPSLADAFYLAGYPFLTLGLALLVRCLRKQERRLGTLDALLFIAAFGLFQWVFVIDELAHASGPSAEKVVALSYPVMDIVLVAGLVFLALTPVWRSAAYRYLSASIVLLLVADEIYGFNPDKYAATTWVDSLWLFSYVLWGVAALSPSMVALTKPRRVRGPRLGTVRLAVLAAALAAAPAILLYQRVAGDGLDVVAVVVGSAVLSAIVLARLTGLVRALDRLRDTERRARADAELAQKLVMAQNVRLQEADRLKDEFVALISHDLRTPLTSIMGYVELALEEESLPDATRSYLEVVDRNAERLLRLVNDLLFVARLQVGDLMLEAEELDLAEVVRASVAEVEPRAAAQGIKLTTDVDDVPSVHADKGRILQVLDNLISNAIKFTPAGGDVRISLAQSNGAVRLDVSDTGIGIPPDEQEHLFERFFRASSAVQQQLPGTGLGLYIARAIAEAHRGSLAVQSELGRGSTFSLELPTT